MTAAQAQELYINFTARMPSSGEFTGIQTTTAKDKECFDKQYTLCEKFVKLVRESPGIKEHSLFYEAEKFKIVLATTYENKQAFEGLVANPKVQEGMNDTEWLNWLVEPPMLGVYRKA